MNKILHYFVVPILGFGLMLNLSAAESVADPLSAAKQKMQAKDYVGADQIVTEALLLTKDDSKGRIDALFLKGQIAELLKDSPGALEQYAKVLADPGSTPSQKVQAHLRMANVQVKEKKLAEAREEYGKIEKLDGATPSEVMNAKFAVAKLHESQRQYDEASKIYADIFTATASSPVDKIRAGKAQGAVFVTTYQDDKARAEYAKVLALPDLDPSNRVSVAEDIAKISVDRKNFPKAREEYSKGLALEGISDKDKIKLLSAIAGTYQKETDLPGMKKALKAFGELKPDYNLLRSYALLAELRKDFPEAAATWSQILLMPDLSKAQYAVAFLGKLGALADERKPAEAKALAVSAEKDVNLGDKEKFLASLVAAGFTAAKGAQPGAIPPPPKSMSADSQAEVYLAAAKIFMRARDYEKARFFGDRAESLFPPAPQYVYECQFMEQAPFGVSGWENSKIVKDSSRRETRFEEYNKQAAAVLNYDVNAVREVSTGDAKAANLGFYMAADARGWHIYVQRPDDQRDEVLAGLERGGTLEMYFAPGKEAPYFQWILKLPSAEVSFYPWSSPNRNYRKIDDYFHAEVAPVADGFGAYIFIPWDLVYDKLPKEGDLWTFGLVNFSRNGAFTWGSGQVHELSKFGKIKFTGVDKAMPAMKRAIVMEAYGKFKKSSKAATTFWNDEVKGDQKFYSTVLLPEIDALNEKGKLVRPEMTPEEVELLFAQTVPDWMEFDFLVAELRTKYLEDQFFTK